MCGTGLSGDRLGGEVAGLSGNSPGGDRLGGVGLGGDKSELGWARLGRRRSGGGGGTGTGGSGGAGRGGAGRGRIRLAATRDWPVPGPSCWPRRAAETWTLLPLELTRPFNIDLVSF